MAMMMSKPVALQSGVARTTPSLSLRSAMSVRRMPLRVQALQSTVEMQEKMVKAAAFSSLAATWLTSGNACAATEVMSQAAGDGRANVLLVFPAIALGWVLYNIGGPALNQLGEMGDKQSGKRAASVVGLLAASLFAAGNADAAQEFTQLSAGDSRVLVIATLFVPIVGWVLLNIGGPALNQFRQVADKTSPDTKSKKRSFIGATGLGLSAASLLAAQSADAATEISQLAANDGRLTAIATLFVPIVGWVLFNIGGPALNQYQNIAEKNAASKGRQ